MPTTERDIESFARFAKERIAQHQGDLSMDEIYDEWRSRERTSDDAAAITAALRDMSGGETGQPFDEFAEEFRARNSVEGA